MKCSTCQEDKAEDEFAFKFKARGVRQTACRGCVRSYRANHYRKNAASYKKRGAVNGKAKREELLQKVYDYLAQHPCVDCGEMNPIVLDFDHRDGEEKLLTVSTLRHRCYSWKKIMAEIGKCDVRCANCHRIRTAQQFGWSNLNLVGHLSSVGRALD